MSNVSSTFLMDFIFVRPSPKIQKSVTNTFRKMIFFSGDVKLFHGFDFCRNNFNVIEKN